MVLVRMASFDGGVTLAVTVSPETDRDHELEERVAALEALIEEARRRARRRRQLYAAAVLVAMAAGAAAYFGHDGGGDVSLGRSVAEGSVPSLGLQSGAGRWGPSHGPEGGWVPALAINPASPKIIYAGGWGNVFKSTNGGGTWKDVTGEPWTRVTALAVNPMHPRIVYAGTDRGIAKTTDGGHHWRMVNAGLFKHETRHERGHRLAEGFLSTLIIDAHQPDTVYAVTDRGLFRTTNGGGHWRVIGARALYYANCDNCVRGPYGYPVAAAIDPQRAQTIYASWPGTPVYKSNDAGDHWRPQSVPGTTAGFLALALDTHRPGTLYAAPLDWDQRGLFKSNDEGATWRIVGLRKQHVTSVMVDPNPAGNVVAITAAGAFKSSDGGANWQAFGKGAALRSGTVVTDPRSPETVYGAGEDGVAKSTDGGRTWRSASNGLVSTMIGSLVLASGSSKVLYAGVWQGVFKSANGGRTWRLTNGGMVKRSVLALAAGTDAVYAGTLGSGIFKSLDGGRTWRPVNTGLTARIVQALAIDPREPSTVYVVSNTSSQYAMGNGGTIFKTVDGGASWRAIIEPKNVQTVAVDPHQENIVFAGTTRGLFRSSDGGDNWELVATAPGAPTPLGKLHVSNPDTFQTIAFDPVDPRIVYAGIRTRGILKSSDGGKTWVKANTGLTNKAVSALAVDPRDPRIVYVSTGAYYAGTGGGVFRSTNGGRSWHRFGRGLSATGVAVFAIDPAGRTIYAGTGGDGVVDFRLR
jgi:photosystem II stability/assembly factor-like uncharacterized protein